MLRHLFVSDKLSLLAIRSHSNHHSFASEDRDRILAPKQNSDNNSHISDCRIPLLVGSRTLLKPDSLGTVANHKVGP